MRSFKELSTAGKIFLVHSHSSEPDFKIQYLNYCFEWKSALTSVVQCLFSIIVSFWQKQLKSSTSRTRLDISIRLVTLKMTHNVSKAIAGFHGATKSFKRCVYMFKFGLVDFFPPSAFSYWSCGVGGEGHWGYEIQPASWAQTDKYRSECCSVHVKQQQVMTDN